MSDPKRLLDSVERGEGLGRLLAAGKSEVPDGVQMAALAAKLGILGGLGGAGAAGALGGGGASGAGAGAGAGASAGAGKVAVGVTAAKAGLAIKIGGAVVVASAVGASAIAVSKTHEEAPRAPVGIVATVTPADTATTSPARAGASTRILGLSETNSAASAESSARVAQRSSTTARATTSASGEGAEAEVRLLERAQDALRSRPAEALALADDHARRFPQGMLVQEREVIAIEALVKTGRTDEAKARAARFKSRFPGSSHTRRLQTLVGE